MRPDPLMAELVATLGDQHAELRSILDGLDGAAWHRASRCDGWDVADVVLHLAQTDELALASAQGRFGDALAALTAGIGPGEDVDDGAARMVERERGIEPAELAARWDAGARALRDALTTADPHARVDWVAGPLSVRTLATTRLAETWIHTGDVAAAAGLSLEPTPRLRHVARLAWRTLPYAFNRAGEILHGPVRFDLTGPGGDRWRFEPDEPAVTTIAGDAVELCLVAARRLDPSATGLRVTGPDGATVLELVRTYA